MKFPPRAWTLIFSGIFMNVGISCWLDSPIPAIGLMFCSGVLFNDWMITGCQQRLAELQAGGKKS